jgi:hypothetical protein
MIDRAVLIWYNWQVLKISPGEYIHWKTWGTYNLLLAATFLISLQL